MSKTAKLLLAGILPLALGFAYNYLIMLVPLPGFILILLNLAFIVLWGYLAYALSSSDKNPVVQSALLCAFGLLMLAMVLYQELSMGQYWPNLIGSGTQMYFLPFLSAASTVFSPLASIVAAGSPIRIWPLYICVLLLMFIVSGIGCLMKRRKV